MIKTRYRNYGQAAVEYLIVSGALITALLVPVDNNDNNIIEICLQAIRDWYVAFAYAKSLPALPG